MKARKLWVSFRLVILSSLVLILVSCFKNHDYKKDFGNVILFETRWYSLALPIDWRYTGTGASCTFTSPNREVAIILSPVVLESEDTVDKIIREVESSVLHDQRGKTLKHWHGQYSVGSQSLPALFAIRQVKDKRIEVINTHISRCEWLLGITIIRDINHKKQSDVDILSTLEVKHVKPVETEKVRIADI
jgi:hypothetical protein